MRNIGACLAELVVKVGDRLRASLVGIALFGRDYEALAAVEKKLLEVSPTLEHFSSVRHDTRLVFIIAFV